VFLQATSSQSSAATRRLLPAVLAPAERDEALLAALISHGLPRAAGVDACRRFAAREEGWTYVVVVESGRQQVCLARGSIRLTPLT
jgi:hypothetical protein